MFRTEALYSGTPSARYEMPTTTKHNEFRVRHFAGTVVYTVGSPEEPESSFLMKITILYRKAWTTVVLRSNKFFNNVGGLEIGLDGIDEGERASCPTANTGMNAPETHHDDTGVEKRGA